MTHSQKIVENRFQNHHLDGRQVNVIPYPADDDIKIISNALSSFDSNYQANYTSKSQLSLMPQIKVFFEYPNHCRMTD